MNNRVGSLALGADFHDREVERARLEEHLLLGEHVSLVAQRRVGKTSLLREVAARLTGRVTCLYVDLEGCQDAGDAVAAIAAAARPHMGLWTTVQQVFANTLDTVQSVSAHEIEIQLRNGLVGDWRAKGDRLMAALASGDKPVALLLDEVPVLLVRLLREADGAPRPGGRDEADRLLSWLRKAALAHPGRLSVVVTGSIGLEPVARQAGLSGTLNIYRPLPLGAWPPAVAIDALGKLAQTAGLHLRTEAAEAVVERLRSCIPYHVQLTFSQLEEDARRRKSREVSPADVERVYATRLLASHAHAELAHMEERLKLLVPGPRHALTIELLTEAAVGGALTIGSARQIASAHVEAGPRQDEALREIFDLLEHDGYIERGPDGARRFVSALLQSWWRRRFGEFHVSAATRGAL